MTHIHDPQDMAILVSSCDAYSDAWKPYFESFFAMWPDCPFQIYLLSETKEYFDARLTVLHTREQSWSRVVRTAFETIPHPYVLYVQEDYFLTERVSTSEILRLLDMVKKEHAACMRLYPSPKPDCSYKNYSDIGSISRGRPYRLSLQATMWDKKIFHDLIKEGESPWQAELEGSARTSQLSQEFLSVKKISVFKYICTGIIRGKWTYDALNFFKEKNMHVDLTLREVEPYDAYVRRRLSNTPVFGGVFRLWYRIRKKLRTSKKQASTVE